MAVTLEAVIGYQAALAPGHFAEFFPRVRVHGD
jgi:hypothetical protein